MKDDILKRWQIVWERKGKEKTKEEFTLQDLIEMNGFDKGASKITKKIWLKAVEIVKDKLDFKRGDILLEIGCGSGAMIFPLARMGIKIVGIDYSFPLIKIAFKVVPKIDALVSEAKFLPFKNRSFDKILSHSVFQYFPNLIYAEKVLLEIFRVAKCNAKILIMDIPDVFKKKESEKYRRGKLSREEYEKLYSCYPHLYYDKGWFENIAKNLGYKFEIFDQNIPQYGNAPFRFNILLWRM